MTTLAISRIDYETIQKVNEALNVCAEEGALSDDAATAVFIEYLGRRDLEITDFFDACDEYNTDTVEDLILQALFFYKTEMAGEMPFLAFENCIAYLLGRGLTQTEAHSIMSAVTLLHDNNLTVTPSK